MKVSEGKCNLSRCYATKNFLPAVELSPSISRSIRASSATSRGVVAVVGANEDRGVEVEEEGERGEQQHEVGHQGAVRRSQG